MVRPIAWYLNLDAEEELRDPGGYAPSAAMQQRVERMAERLGAFLAPGDRVVHGGDAGLGGRFMGQAWCPTPRALAVLHHAGVFVPPAPPLAVLQHVNHRGFCASLGQSLPGAVFVRDAVALRAHLAAHAGAAWLLKRPFGFAGRGRMLARWPVQAAGLDRWISKSLATGDGLQVEPWVERELDVAMHGYVHTDAPPRFGRAVMQACSMSGAWLRSRPASPGELTQPEQRALEQTVAQVASALHDAGYFGPFGVDAFRWRDASGTVYFNPRSEINARYTMGWHIGMRAWRPGMTD